jgi:hypothetical protein
MISFAVDGKKFWSETPFLTGAQVLAIAGKSGMLFVEHREAPDVSIGSDQVVLVSDRNFYVIPM